LLAVGQLSQSALLTSRSPDLWVLLPHALLVCDPLRRLLLAEGFILAELLLLAGVSYPRTDSTPSSGVGFPIALVALPLGVRVRPRMPSPTGGQDSRVFGRLPSSQVDWLTDCLAHVLHRN